MLKLVIHFNLYKVWGLGWRFFFNLWMSNCPRTIWWKFYLNSVVFADLSKLRHVCGYFYVLYSVPMSMSIPPPLPHRYYYFSYQSVQFSHWVISDSLQPQGLQHTRPPCPSPTPKVYSNSRPLSRWCHPTISSSVIAFSSCRQSFLAWRSFLMSQLFASGGQSIGVSASTSVLSMNIQDWLHLGWTGWISLQSKDSQESSPTSQFKSISC